MHIYTGADVAQQSKGELSASQIRGVWHRPNSSERERNLDELKVVLDELFLPATNFLLAVYVLKYPVSVNGIISLILERIGNS